MIINILKKILTLILIRKKPIVYARKIGVSVGSDCRFIGITTSTFGSEPYLIKIGNRVTITRGVHFVTHDGAVWVFRLEHSNIDLLAPIEIGNNVFIGMNSILLPGTKIGDNCILGAGSVARGNLDSDSVYAGIPAKKICSLNEYKIKNEHKFTPTKKMTAAEKKKYFMDLEKNE